ncbi:A disintegrin and metalloproteinase with thrombospondin motifs like [Haemaphysalis longicornis]
MGYGYVAAACGMFRVALGEDSGETYKGVRVMAHEIGHVLGCPHDGQTAIGYAKYTPDSRSCSWYDGYLMSHQEKDSRSMKFSRCCNRQMSIFARTREAQCLIYSSSITRIAQEDQTALLPGQEADRNQQCRNAYPTIRQTYWISNKGDENCTIHCFVPKDEVFDDDMEWPTFLSDGSQCGNNVKTVCINGDCVEKRAKYAAKGA